MLGDHATIPRDRGIFLPVSRRMHPDVCAFVSQQVYEGRLASETETARQAVRGTSCPQAGAFWVPVAPQGHAQAAPEEVAAIQATIRALLSGRWTHTAGLSRPPRPAEPIVEIGRAS